MPPVLNVWDQDLWGFTQLTEGVNILPHKPSMLGDLGIFQKEGINTLTVSTEYKNGGIYLVQTSPRGTPGKVVQTEKRKGRVFAVSHIQENGAVLADDVAGVREFNTTQMQTVDKVANDKLQMMKDNIDATLEWHRIGAIKGLILDADATTVLYDLNTEFGIARPTQDFDFSSDSDDVRVQCHALARTIRSALGGNSMNGVGVLCSDTFFDKLIQHDSVKDTYKYFAAAADLRQNLAWDVFDFAGCRFINYRGVVSDIDFVTDDEALAFPLSTSGLFKEYYGYADYEETVNTIGLPYYAKSEQMEFNRGRKLEVQSNPLVLNHRPSSCVNLTMTTA